MGAQTIATSRRGILGLIAASAVIPLATASATSTGRHVTWLAERERLWALANAPHTSEAEGGDYCNRMDELEDLAMKTAPANKADALAQIEMVSAMARDHVLASPDETHEALRMALAALRAGGLNYWPPPRRRSKLPKSPSRP